MPRLRVLGMLSPMSPGDRLEAWHRMSEYVEKASLSAPGGSGYFERLDRFVSRDGDIHRAMVRLAHDKFGPRVGIIVSGGFGLDHREWSRANRAGQRPVVLPGGLRYKNGPDYNDEFRDYRRQMVGVREWAFLDDSLYRGRTMDWVRNLVLMTGSAWAGAVVAYDGSRGRMPGVHSLYRYFDHHTLPE